MVPRDRQVGHGDREDVPIRRTEVHAATVGDGGAQDRARRRDFFPDLAGVTGKKEQGVGGRRHDEVPAHWHGSGP